jgi:hypothetical protein
MLHPREGLSKSDQEEYGQDGPGGKGGQPAWSLSPKEIGKYVMILHRISSFKN